MLLFSREGQVPIIFTPQYDFDFRALGCSHPSENRMPSHIFESLIRRLAENGRALSNESVFCPTPITDEDVLLVHHPKHLKSLRHPFMIAKIIETPSLRDAQLDMLHRCLVTPQRFTTGGTVLGMRLCTERGWALNILGGLHHAKALVGEGFCFFADVAIAFRKLRSSLGIEDMLIVDLDAHQGNGNASILGKDPNVRIMDVFNRQIYPSEKGAVERVRYCYPIASKTTDAEYLDKVRNGLERVLQDGRPQLIVYIAGYDVLIGDPLGQLSLSLQGCVERDCLVWQFAIEHEIPILMLLAGGYGAAAGEAAGYCAAQCLVRFTAAGNAQPRETGPTTVPSGSEETS